METPTPTPVSPWSRKRAAPFTEVVELPELGVTVTLQNLDTLRTSAGMQEAQRLIAEYVGSEESDTEPELFVDEDGEELQLNEAVIKDVCLLRAMQVAEKPYGFEWWLGVALNCEAEYILLSAAAQRLNRKAQRRAGGNSTKASGSGSRPSPPSAG